MKKEKRVKDVILASNDKRKHILPYSASGYFSMVARESYKYDQVRLLFVKMFIDVAEQIVLLLRLNGWDLVHEDIKKETTTKLRCNVCRKTYTTQSKFCPVCKSEGDTHSFVSYKYLLEKTGALEAQQNYTLKECYEDEAKLTAYEMLEKLREVETMKDRIILRRA